MWVLIRSAPYGILFLLITTLFAFDLANGLVAEKAPKYTGTFTSLTYNEEGGDLLGEEIKIVLARNGYQGALQLAEGEPSNLIVVDVSFDKNKVKFEIPASYPIYGGGIFEGTIDA